MVNKVRWPTEAEQVHGGPKGLGIPFPRSYECPLFCDSELFKPISVGLRVSTMEKQGRRADGSKESRRKSLRKAFRDSSLRISLVYLVALKIAGIALFFDPAGIEVFDLPKSLFSRALEWLIAGLLSLLLLGYGTAIVPRTRLNFAVGLVLIANALSF